MAELVFTGERFLPERPGEIWLEHWHRYHFAAGPARGRRVLDIASGEGYGSALLARTAQEVVGVDVAVEAIAHARVVYRERANLRFVSGDCASLPFADAMFDMIVSFETIEHITAQREFLSEVRRVLAPGGLFLLSSPNKAEYSDRRGYTNPFHVAELYRNELRALLAEFFPHSAWYGQSIGFCSTIAAEDPDAKGRGELVEPGGAAAATLNPAATVVNEALYYIVGCSLSPEALNALDKPFSVLGDPEGTVYRDYQDTYRKFVDASAAVSALRERAGGHAIELERSRATAQSDLDAARADAGHARAQAAAAEGRREDALAARAAAHLAHATLQAGHAALQDAHAALEAEQRATRDDAARLQVQLSDLHTLTAKLGAASHAAQQSALKLSTALHEANARYQSALDAAHRSHAELAASTEVLQGRQREVEATRDAHAADAAGLRQTVASQQAELDRRAHWRWRLRRPGRRD